MFRFEAAIRRVTQRGLGVRRNCMFPKRASTITRLVCIRPRSTGSAKAFTGAIVAAVGFGVVDRFGRRYYEQ